MAEIWQPVACPENVKAALKALNAGVAVAAQQQLALNWVLFDLCKIRDELFVPRSGGVDGRRVTDYLLGRRSVGLQIARAFVASSKPPSPRGPPPAMPAAKPAEAAAPTPEVKNAD